MTLSCIVSDVLSLDPFQRQETRNLFIAKTSHRRTSAAAARTATHGYTLSPPEGTRSMATSVYELSVCELSVCQPVCLLA